MPDVSVSGADKFYHLSKALKAAGRSGMRKELNSQMRRAGAPLVAKTRAVAASSLPQAGGLAALVAKEPQRVQVRTGEATAGVRIVVGRRRGGARAADRGSVRHPVFGQRGVFAVTQVEPGWFSKTLEDEGPEIARPFIEEALNGVVRRIIREAGG